MKILFGFNFRVDFIWVSLISSWVGFCFIRVGLIFWVRLILNRCVMSCLSCK